MPIDSAELRKRYASMDDEELLTIDRDDLTTTAQSCLDAELLRRGLTPETRNDPEELDAEEQGWISGGDALNDGPDWMESAFAASTHSHQPSSATDAADARDALEAAGIPCTIVQEEIVPEPEPPAAPFTEYRVMVPGTFALTASSILDKAVFNAVMAEQWRVHMEGLSDDELRGLAVEDLCAGLLDRVERLRKIFKDEVARRARDA